SSHVGGQGQQLLVNARVQSFSVLLCLSGKIRPPDSSYKEGVARQDEPWGWPPPEVGGDQTDTFRRMPRRVQHSHPGISQHDLLSISKRSERQVDLRRFVQTIVGPDASGQFHSTRTMIRVDVRVDDMRDAHVLAFRERRIRLDVVAARVHHHAFAKCAAAEKVRGAAEVEVVERTKNHRRTLQGLSLRASCHQGSVSKSTGQVSAIGSSGWVSGLPPPPPLAREEIP